MNTSGGRRGDVRTLLRRALAGLMLVAMAVIGCRSDATEVTGSSGEYAPVAERLSTFIEHELGDKEIPGLAVALVDDQRIVWARGFGWADPVDSVRATPSTVWRVGPASELLTALAVMRRVEAGELDLDAPVSRYLPDFRPENPHGIAITLRHLMSHRAGLVREPPEGHSFDSTGTPLDETVRSLNETSLVHPPGRRTKYSNAGVAAVSYVLQEERGRPFAEYLEESLLSDLGMDRSAFGPEPALKEDLARAFMWTHDGRRFEAPGFQRGMAPAAGMYTTVRDLGSFLSALFAGGRGPGGQVVDSATLERMWTPGTADDERGFGLGFAVDTLAGERSVGHGGASYGFSTHLTALPDSKLGVVVVTNLDGTSTVAARVAGAALRMMKAVGTGEALPEPVTTAPLAADEARALEGRYGEGDRIVELEAREREVTLMADRGGHRMRVRRLDDGLVTDGRLGFGTRIEPVENGIVVDGDTLSRRSDERPDPAPEEWRGLIGEYGWDYNTLYTLEHRGRLHLLIEWFHQYPLERTGEADVYRFPDRGLYRGERVVFHRDDAGRATAVTVGGIGFERRETGPGGDGTFRIEPVASMEELREAALDASPPVEEGDFRKPDLVELGTLDAPIRFDIRYATTDNFMGSVFYRQPRAYLQRPAATAMARAARDLTSEGYGLLVYDAYRPWFVTKMFWDATPEKMKQFVADASDGSRHNRGAAVDLTLYHLDSGRPAAMVSGYDEFTDRAYPRYPGGTSLERWHRELLRDAMEAQGFSVYDWEWWHFDHGDWREYPILNEVFEELE